MRPLRCLPILLIVLLPAGCFQADTSQMPAESAAAAPPRISSDQAAALAVTALQVIEDGLQLSHPRHGAEFTAEGLRFTPRGGGPEWRWSLTSIGSEEQPLEGVLQTSVAPVAGEHSIVRYRRGPIEERYLPRKTGVEQQFVLHEPLELSGADLVIAGRVESAGRFEETDSGWQWSTEAGAVTLGEVYAFDARGNEIPARMIVAAHSTRIEVDGAALARAAYPVTIDPEIGANDFRISDMGPDGDVAFSALGASVAYNPTADEYLVVWRGEDMGDQEWEVFGQRIEGSTGTEVGENDFRISDMGPDGDGAFGASSASVAYNPSADEYLVVWRGDDDTGSLVDNELEIFGQRLDGSTGTEVGANDFRISDMGPDGDPSFDAEWTSVAYNPSADEYLVVWFGSDDTGTLVDNEREIFGQRLDGSTGAEVGLNDFRISDMGPAGVGFSAVNPSVAYNPTANEYLVVWRGLDTPVLRDFEIFGQRLDGSTAAEVGLNDFRISDMGPDGSTSYGAATPSVAYNPSADEYLVVWFGGEADTRAFEELDIFGQRLDGSTAAEVGANDFRISDEEDGARELSVAYNLTANEYLVVWGGTALASRKLEIFGQRIDGSTGAEVGPNDFRISDMAGFALAPSVAYNPSADEFLVVWDGVDDTGSLENGEVEIFGQRIVTPPILSTPGPKLYEASLILHHFTTALPASWMPTNTSKFVARPLGVGCNPLQGGMYCYAATFQEGAPLVGSGTASVMRYTDRPALFTLPRGALAATVTGSLPLPIFVYSSYYGRLTYNYGPITHVETSAQASNAFATFAALGPYRSISSTPPAPGPGMHRVTIHEGPNRFGGTMRLLGHLGSKRQHPYPDVTNLYKGTGTSLLGYIGTGAVAGGGGRKAFGTFTYVHQSLPTTTMANLTAWNWAWTTGTVTATVSNGNGDPVVLQRAGYDRRTPAESYGTIRLVTPQIVHWDFPNRTGAPWDRNGAAIGILRIKFLPEPSSWLMLVAGIGLLGVFYRRRR